MMAFWEIGNQDRGKLNAGVFNLKQFILPHTFRASPSLILKPGWVML
jgi:hypothetical protein